MDSGKLDKEAACGPSCSVRLVQVCPVSRILLE